MELEDALRAISVIGSGMAAGLLLTVLFVLAPLGRSLDRPSALRVKTTQVPLIDRINPPVVIVSTLAGLALLVFGDGLSDTATALTAVGAVGGLGIAVMSLGFNIPINRAMLAMSKEDPPPEFEPMLDRWTRFHIIRTAFGTIAFVAFTVAALPSVASSSSRDATGPTLTRLLVR